MSYTHVRYTEDMRVYSILLTKFLKFSEYNIILLQINLEKSLRRDSHILLYSIVCTVDHSSQSPIVVTPNILRLRGFAILIWNRV